MVLADYLNKLPDERFLAIYTGLENQGFGPLDKQVADSLRFRPHAVRRLPMEKRARRAKHLLLANGGNEELCYELFGTYLMTKHKQLVTSFLDQTDVVHEEGMIENVGEGEGTPSEDKIAAAIEQLDADHDPDDVTLYLGLCASMWPESAVISELWTRRAGLAG